MTDYTGLLPYCQTDNQRSKIELLIKHGSLRKASQNGAGNVRELSRTVKRVREYAAEHGYYPPAGVDRPTLPGFGLKRVSTLARNEFGEPQWQIQEKNKEDAEKALRDFVEGMSAEVPRAKPKREVRKNYRDDILPAVFIGDAHVGMYAYAPETKHSDFDVDIATGQLRDACDYLVDKMEPSEQGLLVDVGDFMHANSSKDQTFNGTDLDTDTRLHNVMYQSGMAMRYMVSRMLDKCQNVTVVIAQGNHNPDPAKAVQLMLQFYYESEPRVKVLPTPGLFHYVEYGNWLLGVNHGDKIKPDDLAGVMARDMSQAWGRTTHRMWCTGHYHKRKTVILPGVEHRVFGALPPPDAWHAGQGYGGDSEMEMLTFRKSGGLHSSHIYNIPRPQIEPDVKIGDDG